MCIEGCTGCQSWPRWRLGCWLLFLLLVSDGMVQAVPSVPKSVSACWSEGTDPTLIESLEQSFAASDKFRQSSRWTSSAYSPGPFSQGDPIVLTFSFVPDGSLIASGAGESEAGSNLFAVMNGLYGDPQTWQDLFRSVFDRWSEVCGVQYILEGADDGSPITLQGAPGVAGVRGDIRIGGKFIDGQEGPNILAYSYPPDDGEMVLDTSNLAFYGDRESQSRAFRNVVSHEHGHGLGMKHVCPIDKTKLMEPAITVAFDGPQLDDILNAQRHYGDRFEPNDAAGTPAVLGTFPLGVTRVEWVSLDDDSDQDWYRFAVPPGCRFDLTVSPVGTPYLEGPMRVTGTCGKGVLFDPAAVMDFGIELLAADGVTPIAASNIHPAGASETLENLVLPDEPGTFLLRIAPGAADNIQLYSLEMTVENPPLPAPTETPGIFPAPTPTETRQTVPTVVYDVDHNGRIDSADLTLLMGAVKSVPRSDLLLDFSLYWRKEIGHTL